MSLSAKLTRNKTIRLWEVLGKFFLNGKRFFSVVFGFWAAADLCALVERRESQRVLCVPALWREGGVFVHGG